jgi:antitoxin MazE
MRQKRFAESGAVSATGAVAVEASLDPEASLSVRPAKWNQKAFARELTEARSAMPMSEPVLEELRRGARY